MAEKSLFRDTIYALSSGTTPSGVAVIRLSGPHAIAVLKQMAGGHPPARTAALRTITDLMGRRVDHGLVLFFPGPASFTGEDCAELHLHGGKATVAAVLSTIGQIDGLRSAEAGEFTRRAFLNGKIDLTGAEALADLIAAETETQRRLALHNARGGQRLLYEAWRQRLLHARAMIEAELDFADEADVPGSVSSTVWADMTALHKEIGNHISGYRSAEIIREGFRVVLVGAPNAGKSSLLNALARRDVAIVTDIAGTTRDLVEVSLNLEGVKVIVTDTAGIRQTDDVVEQIGVDRALEAATAADLVLTLIEPDGVYPDLPHHDGRVLAIATKSDLGQRDNLTVDFHISVRTGSGLSELVAAISAVAKESTAAAVSLVPSRLRHVELLRNCSRHINSATERADAALELRAEELRVAAEALGRITGIVDVEELLGVIFSEFCIGK